MDIKAIIISPSTSGHQAISSTTVSTLKELPSWSFLVYSAWSNKRRRKKTALFKNGQCSASLSFVLTKQFLHDSRLQRDSNTDPSEQKSGTLTTWPPFNEHLFTNNCRGKEAGNGWHNYFVKAKTKWPNSNDKICIIHSFYEFVVRTVRLCVVLAKTLIHLLGTQNFVLCT